MKEDQLISNSGTSTETLSKSTREDDIAIYYGSNIKDVGNPLHEISFSDVIDNIKANEELRDLIKELRSLSTKEEQNNFKINRLPFFTFGKFIINIRKKSNLENIRAMVFDLDKTDGQFSEIRKRIEEYPWVYAVFVSPRGEGLKIICLLDEPITDEKRYSQLYKYYTEQLDMRLSIKLDSSTFDISRACFFSYDPEVFVNDQCEKLQTNIDVQDQRINGKSSKSRELIKINSDLDVVEGNRNITATSLTGLYLSQGLDEKAAMENLELWNEGLQDPLASKELKKIVHGVYERYAIDYTTDFSVIRNVLQSRRMRKEEIGEEYCNWLEKNQNVKYFKSNDNKFYIHVQNRLILVDVCNIEYEDLLLKTAKVSIVDKLGQIMTRVIQTHAYRKGIPFKRNYWLATDTKKATVFFNLKNDRNELLRITPEEICIVPNGNNPEEVVMINAPEDKIEPINFSNLDNESLYDGLKLTEKLIVKNICTKSENQWFLYLWRVSVVLYDFTTAHIIARLQGNKGSGKTTASQILSVSLYGKDTLAKSTVAGLYSDASINPLIIEDNLESKEFNYDHQRADFLLGAATGTGRQKRIKNTDSSFCNEQTRALILNNGIESIARIDLTSRMMLIGCDCKKYSSDYSSQVLQEIKDNRDIILSAEFHVIQKVLSRIARGDWKIVQERLKNEFKDHSKERMFEHIGLIILLLEESWKALRKTEDVWVLAKDWLLNQKDTSEEEIIGSNPIIQALDALRGLIQKKKQCEISTHIQDELDKLLIDSQIEDNGTFNCEGTAGNLLSAFCTVYPYMLHMSFPYRSGMQLSQQINNAKEDIIKSGYMINIRKDGHRNQNIFQFMWFDRVYVPQVEA